MNSIGQGKPSLSFQSLKSEDAFSQSILRFIIEDSYGFMWFGAQDGLYKYDGIKLHAYTSLADDPYSISYTTAQCALLDSKNRLWIGTRDGLNIYDQHTNRFYNYSSTKYPALATLRGDIHEICEDIYGNIWISVENGGLFLIKDLNTKAENFKFSTDKAGMFVGLGADINGNVWIGTRDGLLKFNSSTKKFKDLRKIYGSGYQVTKISSDKKGRVFLATSSGLKIIDNKGRMKEYVPDSNNPYAIQGKEIVDIEVYTDNKIILAIDGSGVDIMDLDSEKFYHYTDQNDARLPCKNMTCVFRDSHGDVWAGTFMHGVVFSNSTTNLFSLHKNNPSSGKHINKGVVCNFLKDTKGNLWIATDGGGLFFKKKGQDDIKPYNLGNKSNLSHVPLISIIEDNKGYIWITTYGEGVYRINPVTKGIRNFKNNPQISGSLLIDKVRSIRQTSKNEIWVSGFDSGVSRLNLSTNTFEHFYHDPGNKNTIPSNWIQIFFKDSYENLWGASFNGLCKYQPKTNDFKTYTFSKKGFNKIEANFITEIYEDSQKNLWLGTNGGGIILFDRETEEYKYFNTQYHGFADNNISTIIEDDRQHLWIASSKGITRFNINTKEVKPFRFSEGIPSCSFYPNAKYKDTSGKIYFGTGNGYLVIDPKETKENNVPPAVEITGLQIHKKSSKDSVKVITHTGIQDNGKEYILEYNENALTFDFVVLNFNNPKLNTYAYKLEGFDPDWTISKEYRAPSYTNLDPGSYIFHAKGSNNDQVWNEEGAWLKITILPPWWKTWWFNNLALIVGFAFLLGIIHWQIGSERHKSATLEELVKIRTRELKDSNEQLDAFVYKASHDIKGPLKSIIGLTQVGMKDVKDPVAHNYFDHILKSTNKLDRLLMDLLQLTKVKQATIQVSELSLEDLLQEAIDSFKHFPGFGEIQISKTISSKGIFYSDRNLVYSVIQNLIENPIKYYDRDKESSFLKIKINISGTEAKMTFIDNGSGIDELYKEKVFDMFFKINSGTSGTGLGLYIVKTTVEKLKGKISLTSKIGEGSTFTVTLPSMSKLESK